MRVLPNPKFESQIKDFKITRKFLSENAKYVCLLFCTGNTTIKIHRLTGLHVDTIKHILNHKLTQPYIQLTFNQIEDSIIKAATLQAIARFHEKSP